MTELFAFYFKILSDDIKNTQHDFNPDCRVHGDKTRLEHADSKTRNDGNIWQRK